MGMYAYLSIDMHIKMHNIKMFTYIGMHVYVHAYMCVCIDSTDKIKNWNIY